MAVGRPIGSSTRYVQLGRDLIDERPEHPDQVE